MWILLLIVIGLLFYFIIRTAKTKVQMPKQNESPLDILEKRYSRGEITKEDFDRIKRIWGVDK
jgi:putative membrane protein